MFNIHELEFKKEGKTESILEKYSEFNETSKHTDPKPVKTLSWINPKITISKYSLIKLLRNSEKENLKSNQKGKKSYFVLSRKGHHSLIRNYVNQKTIEWYFERVDGEKKLSS